MQAETIEEGCLRLEVRPAVAARRSAEGPDVIFYLCLFEDEIEARFDAFLDHLKRARCETGLGRDVARSLQPTDAVVIAGRDNGARVARGGACNFPFFWRTEADRIHLSTSLPMEADRRLSRSGLLASLAVVSVTYQNEPNLSLATPLARWTRLRRGAVSDLVAGAGCVSERAIDLAESGGDESKAVDRDALIASIRGAFDGFGRSQRGRPKALVELSGGFDSTLAAVAARSHGVELDGVSVAFPFYEFRFEEDLQKAAARVLGIPRQVLDGQTVFPYAPPAAWPRLDEPATAVISLKRDLEMARFAAERGTERILVGEGGDQVFSENMLEPVAPGSQLARGAFSERGWRDVERVRGTMERTDVRFLRRSTATYLHDARLAVALKEQVGTHTRSPFSDLEVVRCGIAWARLSAQQGVHAGKRILAESFADEIPDPILERKSKASWDGVCARAYAQHGDAIASEISRAAPTLEHVGLDVRWLERRVAELASWQRTRFGQDDREVFAAYAVATWLSSWGLADPRGAHWED